MDDRDLWVFDQNDLQAASMLLLLKDNNMAINKNDKVDLELKKMISERFESDELLHSWVIKILNQVSFLLSSRSPELGPLEISGYN